MDPGVICDFHFANIIIIYLFILLQKAATKVEGDLPPVPEVTPPQTSKEPKTSSGCILQ
jgi:hypothetical protein